MFFVKELWKAFMMLIFERLQVIVCLMGKSVSNSKMMKLHVDAACATSYAN